MPYPLPPRPSGASDPTGFTPHKPPWYPHDDNPWQIVSLMSNNVVTNYSRWCDSLPPGELVRLIHEHQRAMGYRE